MQSPRPRAVWWPEPRHRRDDFGTRRVGGDCRRARHGRGDAVSGWNRSTSRVASCLRSPGFGARRRTGRWRHFLALVLATSLLTPAADVAVAEEPPAGEGLRIAQLERSDPVDFGREVLPILQRNCLACHNENDASADLVLETPAAIRRGGDSGPAVVPGDASGSLLLSVAAHREEPIMPPEDNEVRAKNLTAGELGLLRLWIDQGATGQLGRAAVSLSPPPATLRPVFGLAMTPHGDFVAAGRANRLAVYHVPTGRTVAQLSDPALVGSASGEAAPAHLDIVQSLAASSDGRTLASGGYRTAKIWRRAPLERVRTLKLRIREGPAADTAETTTRKDAKSVLALSDDGRFAALVAPGNTIQIFDLVTGHVERTLVGHVAAITDLAFRVEGTQLASTDADGRVRFWNIADGRRLAEFAAGEASDASAAAASSASANATDGPNHIAINNNGTAHVIRQADGERVAELRTDAWARRKVAQARQATALAERIRGWAEYDRNEVAKMATRAQASVQQAALALEKLTQDGTGPADPKYLAAVESLEFRTSDLKRLTKDVVEAQGVVDEKTALRDAAKERLAQREKEAEAARVPLVSASIAAGGAEVVAVDHDGRLYTFAATDGTPIDRGAAPTTTSPVAVAGNAAGQIVTVASDGTVEIWQGGRWSLARTIGGLEAPELLVDRVTALAFSPDGRHLATGSGEPARSGELKLWDVETGELVRHIEGAHSDSVLDLSFNHDGSLLASCGADQNMRVFEVESGRRVHSFEYHTSHVLGVSWRADARVLATCGADGVVRVWNFKTGNEHKVLKRFEEREVTDVAFLGNSGNFVVGDARGVVGRWDYNGGGGQRLEGSQAFIYRVSASADGSVVAAGGDDGVVHVWTRDGQRLATFE
ncbi:MAG: hypothetical protein DWQ35_10520 [Planctomycetota bacterium]|nr:MAG: hypothetical protein DWQ35_10520 [Planctomycetota bacterium]